MRRQHKWKEDAAVSQAEINLYGMNPFLSPLGHFLERQDPWGSRARKPLANINFSSDPFEFDSSSSLFKTLTETTLQPPTGISVLFFLNLITIFLVRQKRNKRG